MKLNSHCFVFILFLKEEYSQEQLSTTEASIAAWNEVSLMSDNFSFHIGCKHIQNNLISYHFK